MKGEEDSSVFSKEPLNIVETQEEETMKKACRELFLEGDSHLMEEAQQPNVRDDFNVTMLQVKCGMDEHWQHYS